MGGGHLPEVSFLCLTVLGSPYGTPVLGNCTVSCDVSLTKTHQEGLTAAGAAVGEGSGDGCRAGASGWEGQGRTMLRRGWAPAEGEAGAGTEEDRPGLCPASPGAVRAGLHGRTSERMCQLANAQLRDGGPPSLPARDLHRSSLSVDTAWCDFNTKRPTTPSLLLLSSIPSLPFPQIDVVLPAFFNM